MTIIYSIFKNLPLMLIGIVGVGVIIGFHELGHFLFCKIFRVKTPSFSIGFGPNLISKQIGETLFSISAIPFGGYVEIAGIQEVGQGDQKEAFRRDEFSFSEKPYYQKLLILSGGIIFNILMAYALMILLLSLGAPKSPLLNDSTIPPVIGKIIPGLAADKYRLKENDKIIAINEKKVNSSLELHEQIKMLANKEINLTLERAGKIMTATMTIGSVKNGEQEVGQIGIEFAPAFSDPIPVYMSVIKAFSATSQMLAATFNQYLSLFKNRLYGSVGGPIMMLSEVSKSAKHGFRIFLFLLVIINLNLAILNLIPVPILDGGQILFTTIEAIIRQPIPEMIRIGIHYVCWITAMILVTYLSYKDILKLFGF